MAQYLDVESEPDVIDITSDIRESEPDMIDITSNISLSMEEEGNWPPHEPQGGAGISDTDFDADMYPQPDQTVSCASPARTTTMTLFLRTR